MRRKQRDEVDGGDTTANKKREDGAEDVEGIGK